MKRFIYRLSVLIEFIPVIWKVVWYDYEPLLLLMRAQLRHMEKHWHKGCSLNMDKTKRSITESRFICDRLIEDEYTGKPWNRRTIKTLFFGGESFRHYDFMEAQNAKQDDLDRLALLLSKNMFRWWD